MKKEINDSGDYEAARAAIAAAEYATKMEAEHEARMREEHGDREARMAEEQAAWMASGK